MVFPPQANLGGQAVNPPAVGPLGVKVALHQPCAKLAIPSAHYRSETHGRAPEQPGGYPHERSRQCTAVYQWASHIPLVPACRLHDVVQCTKFPVHARAVGFPR